MHTKQGLGLQARILRSFREASACLCWHVTWWMPRWAKPRQSASSGALSEMAVPAHGLHHVCAVQSGLMDVEPRSSVGTVNELSSHPLKPSCLFGTMLARLLVDLGPPCMPILDPPLRIDAPALISTMRAATCSLTIPSRLPAHKGPH